MLTKKQQSAYELKQQCILLRKKINEMFSEFDYILKKMNNKMYLLLDECEYNDFYQFLTNQKININTNTDINIYEFYIKKLKLKKKEILKILFDVK